MIMTDSRAAGAAAGDDGAGAAGAAGAFTTRAWRRAAPIRAAIDEQPLVRGLGSTKIGRASCRERV